MTCVAFWPTKLSTVVLMRHSCIRLSSSVTWIIVAKRYALGQSYYWQHIQCESKIPPPTEVIWKFFIFTAWCTLVQSAVLQSHVVCLSVTLVDCDHIGWNSSKTISPLVSLGRSLFATPTWRVCSKVNTHPPVDLSVGDIRLQIAAEWSHIAQRSQWRA